MLRPHKEAGLPKPGDFYRHYKHNPEDLVPENYTYVVVGLGVDTDSKDSAGARFFVHYRPLYKDEGMLAQLSRETGISCVWSRSLLEWMNMVTPPGSEESQPRFTKVTDPNAIARLKGVSAKMYGCGTCARACRKP